MHKLYVILYFCLACAISWSAKFFMVSDEMGLVAGIIPKGLLQFVAQFGPSLAGLVMISVENGRKGLLDVFTNIVARKVRYKWVAFVLLFELTLFHLVLGFCLLSGYGNVKIQTSHLTESYLNFLLNTLTLALLTGLGEEIGWRGYLLPKLQSFGRIVKVLLILTFFNSLWHLRFDCIALILQNDFAEFSKVYFPDMGLRLLISLPAIIVLIYVFNETRGSLLSMILYHGSANASYEWVKEMTGNANPEFLLPVFAAFLWLTSLYFLPAIMAQARRKDLVTRIS